MSRKNKHIISLLTVIAPFYMVSIVQKFFFTQSEILVESFLGIYMLLGVIGITTVFLLNRYLLGNTLRVFKSTNTKIIIDISIGLLILSIFYFIQSIERITYGMWFASNIDRSAITQLLEKIFSDTIYSLIMVGPFNWINEGFAAISIAFILNNLFSLNQKRYWTLLSIFFVAILIALLQFHNGVPSMISSFIIISISNYIYYRYRSVIPILIATISFQTIDLINYMIYA